MKYVFKILLSGLFLVSAITTRAQSESYLQPFASSLLINPSFAGYNNNTSFHTGNQYYHISNDLGYNLFYATYDTPLNKKKGGIGASFRQGIIGNKNISTSEFDFSYARLARKTSNGKLIVSARTGLLLATKQWYTYLLDEILLRKTETPSPPGKKFTRYYRIKPGFGILYDAQAFTYGLSAVFPLEYNLAPSEEDLFPDDEQFPLDLCFYISKKIGGNRKGLKSSPYELSPELLVFYNDNFILSRATLRIKQIDRSYGIFLQSDFSNNIHCLGGILGFRHKNMRINLNAGIGIPEVSDKTGVNCELSLSMIIPQTYYSKINPWAPRKKY